MSGLSVRGLRASAGDLEIVRGADLEIAAGEHVCLVGPSGAGKTTLLRCVAGLHAPDAGNVAWRGATWSDGSRVVIPPERRGIGMVAQDLALWPHLDARRHLLFTARARGVPAAERGRRADALLERVGLAHRARHKPSELSGGEAQRLALARALLASDGLLLLDEPLGQLDVTLRASLARELAELARASGTAALHVTHDAGEALTLGDRVAVLEGGRIVQCAAPDELARAPATRFVARAAGLVNHVPADLAADFLALVGESERLVRLPDGDLVFAPDALVPVAGDDARRAGRRFTGERWLERIEWRGHALEVAAEPGARSTSDGRTAIRVC